MHKCSECQKSFGQAGHLKIHMLTQAKKEHTLVSNARDLEEAHDYPQWGESTQLLRMPRVLWPSW